MTPPNRSTPPLLDLLLGLQPGAADNASANRWSIEGLACHPEPDAGLRIALDKLEASGLRMSLGPFTLDVARVTLRRVVAQYRVAGPALQLADLSADEAELSDLQLTGPLALPPAWQRLWSTLKQAADVPQAPPGDRAGRPPTDTWCLGPLAAAEGTVHARITDAHLLFDADVAVPIRRGQIDFNDATVEHVGPDSRMGVSRLGVYVDAPNGRSYLYQFDTAPLAGVKFEQRSLLPGPWPAERGGLTLQPFVEALLHQTTGRLFRDVTEQARLLLARTAVSGEVHLGDGAFAAPGLQARVVRQGKGDNVVRLQSDALGRGLTVDVAAGSARQAAVSWHDRRWTVETMVGAALVPGGDNPLFDANGQPTAVTRSALAFCRDYQAHHLLTHEFCDALADAGLLMAQRADITLYGGQRMGLDGFQVIDEARFKALPEAKFLQWRAKGWLPLVYAHLLSIGSWAALVDRLDA